MLCQFDYYGDANCFEKKEIKNKYVLWYQKNTQEIQDLQQQKVKSFCYSFGTLPFVHCKTFLYLSPQSLE